VGKEPQAKSSQGYDKVALSDLIDPVLGKTPKRKNEDYWQGDIRWASAKDISQNETRRIYDTSEYMTAEGKEASNAEIMPEGTLVVIARGSLGLSAQLGEPMTFNQSCYGLKADNSKLLDNFLYYAWQYRFSQIQSVSHGTIFDTITMDSFKDIDIPLPSLDTQKKISSVLTSIDDKIETNNRINNTLEDIAQTLFKSCFVEFEPYDEFKQSELGNIPVEFEIKNISEFADIILGNSPKSEYYNENGDGLPFFQGSKNFGLRYPEIERYCTKKKKVAKEDDVLISIRAPVGDVNRATEKCVVGRGVTALRMQEYDNEFLYHLLKANKQNWGKYKSGTTFNSINKTDIQEFPVALPPSEEISSFNSLTSPMARIFKNNVEENKTLSNLRDILIPKLMSGDIRVDQISLESTEVSNEA
jgi:type I restriction enzyme S subunit